MREITTIGTVEETKDGEFIVRHGDGTQAAGTFVTRRQAAAHLALLNENGEGERAKTIVERFTPAKEDERSGSTRA